MEQINRCTNFGGGENIRGGGLDSQMVNACRDSSDTPPYGFCSTEETPFHSSKNRNTFKIVDFLLDIDNFPPKKTWKVNKRHETGEPLVNPGGECLSGARETRDAETVGNKIWTMGGGVSLNHCTWDGVVTSLHTTVASRTSL